MNIKKIKAKSRRASPTAAYIGDQSIFGLRTNSKPGDKVINLAFCNFASATRAACIAELEADVAAYDGKGEPLAHWVVSHRPGVKPRLGEMKKFWQQFLADQGLKGHKIIIGDHWDGERWHSHALVCRIAPEPDESGAYKIPSQGARCTWKNRGKQNDEIRSARATVRDFCRDHGYKPGLGTMAGEEDHPPQADKDKIHLGQRIESAAAHAGGHPHPRQLAAEKAVEIFRSSQSQTEAEAALAMVGMTFRIVERPGRPLGGVVAMPRGEKIYLSSLPEDCRLKNLQAKWAGAGGVDAPRPPMPEPRPGPDFYGKYERIGKIKSAAKKAISTATTMAEVHAHLSKKGLKIETYGKSGAYLRYGPGDEDKIKLTLLGSQYSLYQLAKRFPAAPAEVKPATPAQTRSTQQVRPAEAQATKPSSRPGQTVGFSIVKKTRYLHKQRAKHPSPSDLERIAYEDPDVRGDSRPRPIPSPKPAIPVHPRLFVDRYGNLVFGFKEDADKGIRKAWEDLEAMTDPFRVHAPQSAPQTGARQRHAGPGM